MSLLSTQETPGDLSDQSLPSMILPACLLGLLLAMDGICFGLHIARVMNPSIGTDLYLLEHDRGYGEFFQYIKTLWVVLLLTRLGLHRRDAGFVVWAMVYLYLLADDALGFHEHGGTWLTRSMELPEILGLRGQDLGELLVTATAGGVLLIAVMACYAFQCPSMRKVSRQMMTLTLGIAFFGVGVDMVHSMLRFIPGLYSKAGVIEDGGEMLMMSVVLWYVLVLTVRQGRPAASILGSLRQSMGLIFRKA